MTSVTKPEFIPGGYPSTPDQDGNKESSPFDSQPNSQPNNDESILTKVTNLGSSALESVVGSNPSGNTTEKDQHNDESILTKVTNMGSSALSSVVGSNPSGDTTKEGQRSPSSNQHNDESIITKVTNMGSSALGSIVGSNPTEDKAAEGQRSPSSNQQNDESYLTKETNVGSSALGGIVGSNPSDEKAAEDKRSPSSNQPNLSSTQTESQDSSNRNDESILTKVTNMGSSTLGSVVGSNDKAAESQRSPSSNQHNDESFITKVTNMGSSALGGIVGSNPSDNTATEGQHNPSSNQPNDESYLAKVTNKGSSALGGVGSNPSGDRSTEGQHGPLNQPNITSPHTESQPSTDPNDESLLTKVTNMGSSALGRVFGSIPFGDKSQQSNQTKISEGGSSALGGVGVNPHGDDSGSPSHLSSESPKGEVDTSHTLKPQKRADPNSTNLDVKAILPETRTKHKKTFDLTGDYNQAKENEQRADEQDKRDHKPSGEHHHQEAKDNKKHESIDFGVKPLHKQPPLPYRPLHDETGSKGHATPHVPPKDHATPHVPPKDHTAPPNDHTSPPVPLKVPDRSVDEHHQGDGSDDLEGHKITRKDKVNATIDRAVGTLKQKFGKLVKNDQMVSKGADQKCEADKVKEIADIQRQSREF
jgi:uncharacterized protein YjbJ (UPF0337 family)